MAWTIERKGIFYTGWNDGKKDRYQSTRSNDPAVAEKKRLEKELARTVAVGPVAAPQLDMDMDTLARLYKNEVDIQESTLRINGYSWDKFKAHILNKPIVGITTTDVKDFKNQLLQEKAAPASISIYLRDINKLFGFAVEKGLMQRNPCKKAGSRKWAIEHPQQEESWRFLSKEEEEKLLAACNPLLHRMVTVALETGLRISQVIGMDWKRYDSKNHLYIVPPQKRQRIRRIPILERALEAMGSLKMGGMVFPGTNADMVQKMFARAVRKSLGKQYCTFHDLRHTFVSRWAKILSPVEVRDLMGWSSLALVDRYTHSRTTDIQTKMQAAQAVSVGQAA